MTIVHLHPPDSIERTRLDALLSTDPSTWIRQPTRPQLTPTSLNSRLHRNNRLGEMPWRRATRDIDRLSCSTVSTIAHFPWAHIATTIDASATDLRRPRKLKVETADSRRLADGPTARARD